MSAKPNYKAMVEAAEAGRQQSLFDILDRAVADAAQASVPIYVIHAPVYVDEFATGEHVYGPREAALVMYPKREKWGLPWAIDARIEPDGDVFLTHVRDIVFCLAQSLAQQRQK
jgi:hypothetical protein